ncbi:MAG: hypothetical protein ABIE94_00480 [archaeon]
MVEDDFELVSHDEIEKLRKEVDQIKKSPFGDTQTGMTLLDSMNDLTRAINNLVSIFENTEKELLNEYSKEKAGYKIDTLLQQNKEIAEGIIKVAEMVKAPPKKEQFMPPPRIRDNPSFPPVDFHEPKLPSRPASQPHLHPHYPPMPRPAFAPRRPVPSGNKDEFGLAMPPPPSDLIFSKEKSKKKRSLFGKK